jgi:hypothetical protein
LVLESGQGLLVLKTNWLVVSNKIGDVHPWNDHLQWLLARLSTGKESKPQTNQGKPIALAIDSHTQTAMQ